MTPDTFIAKHGPAWKQFEFSDMGRDLLLLIESQHPARSIPTGQDMANLRLVGAPVLLNVIAGYEELALMIRKLGAEKKPKPVETPDEFSEEERL